MQKAPRLSLSTGQRSYRDYDRRRRQDAQLARAQKLRSSGRWARFRSYFKSRHPLCIDPLNHHGDSYVVAMVDVHHIKPLKNHPELCFVESNCAGLCKSCHNAIEAMVRRGQRTCHLFEDTNHENRQYKVDPQGGIQTCAPIAYTPR